MHIIRRWLTGIAYAVLVLPLVFSLLFSSPYIFVQVHLARALAVLAIMPLIFCWIFDARSRPRITSMTGSLLAFGIGLSILNIFSMNRQVSYMGTWDRFGSVADWVALVIIYLTLRTVFTTKKDWLRYFIFHTILATIVALVGLAQLVRLPIVYFDGTRIFSTLGNPAFLGAYLLLSIGVGMYCFRVVRYRTLIAASVSIQIMILLYTYARSAVLGLCIALLLIALISYWHVLTRRFDSRRIFILFGISAAIIMGFSIIALGVAHSIRPVFDAARPREIVDQTTKSRIINTGIAVAGFRDKPVFGWGMGTYSIVFQKYYDPRLYYGSDHTAFFDKSHNEYLDRAVETGIVGLLLWLNLLLAPVWRAVKERKEDARLATILLPFIAGYASYLIFSFSSIADSLLFIVLFAIIASSDRNDRLAIPEKRQRKFLQISMIIFSVGLLCATQLKITTANILVRRGETAGSLTQAARFFREAWLFSIASQIRITDAMSSRIGQRARTGDLVPAYIFLERSLQTLIPLMPYDVRYLAQLARVKRILAERSTEKIDEAYSLANAAVELSPHDPQLYHLRGLIQLDRSITTTDVAQQTAYRSAMIEDFATAYALAPHIHETAILYLVGTGYDKNDFNPLFAYVEQNRQSLRMTDWRLVLVSLDLFRQDALFDMTLQQMRKLPSGTVESILASLGFTGEADLSQ